MTRVAFSPGCLGAYLRISRYYFYLSVGGGCVGVVVADSVKGPWTDPLGKPLLGPETKTTPSTTFRDPCVFRDDDGSHYIIAGVFNYFITKLAPDMISLAEIPKYVTVIDPYGPCGVNVTDDKPFMYGNDFDIILARFSSLASASATITAPYRVVCATLLDSSR